MSQSQGHEPIGSVAEEAAKLIGALSGWAREQGDGVPPMAGAFAGSVADELHEHLATGSPECGWCPVCRTVTAFRQASPEVRNHLAGAASSLMLAISGLMTTQRPRDDSGVERIDLDAEDHVDDPSEDPI